MAEIQGKVSRPPTAATVTPASQSAGGGTWWVVDDPSVRQEPGHPNSQVINQAAKPQGHEFVYGPYKTKAEADARLKEIRSPITPPSIPNPLSGIGAVGHWIGDIVEHLTDTAMWRSLGWMWLGIMLVVTGIYLWFRTSSTYKGLESAVVGTAKAL
jgi:hypothetical protein